MEPSLKVLDRCRIRWGTVTAVGVGTVSVVSQPLVWDEERLALGDPVAEEVVASGDAEVSAATEVGDVVSLHWDYVCDRLTPHRLARLRREHAHHLDIVNRASGPLGSRLTA